MEHGAPRRRASARLLRRWLPRTALAVALVTLTAGCNSTDVERLGLRDPLTTTVPIANANYYTPAGDAVLWDSTASHQLFTDLQDGQPVPANLISGSTLG